MEVKLVCQGGRHAGKEIPVRGPEFLIGRAEDCHLRAASREVSRRHAVILVEEGGVVVRDSGSSNGTFVNGERVEGERELNGDDVLQIGSLRFVVQRSVDIGGRKRPKTKSVKEAAVRTAQTPRLDDDDVDVGQWFDEKEDSVSPDSGLNDTQPAAPDAAASDDNSVVEQHRGDDPQQQPEQRPPQATPPPSKTDDSKSAAGDMLRKLVNRRS